MSYIDDEELKTGDIDEEFGEETEEEALELDDDFLEPEVVEEDLLTDEEDEEDDLMDEFSDLDEDGNY